MKSLSSMETWHLSCMQAWYRVTYNSSDLWFALAEARKVSHNWEISEELKTEY
jgi:hypothetical protein